jgi:hypothetical protein
MANMYTPGMTPAEYNKIAFGSGNNKKQTPTNQTQPLNNSGGGSSKSVEVVSSRVIYDDNNNAIKRINTYSDGSVTYENLQTGASSSGKVTPGTKASEISIPEENVQSYQQQKSFVSSNLGKSTEQGYVLSSGEVTTDINKARSDLKNVNVTLEKQKTPSYVIQNGQVAQGQSFKEGYYALPSGKITTSRAEAEASVNQPRELSYDIAIQEAQRKTKEANIKKQQAPIQEGLVNFPDGTTKKYPTQQEADQALANARLFQRDKEITNTQRYEQIRKEYAKEKPVMSLFTNPSDEYYQQRGLPMTTLASSGGFGFGLQVTKQAALKLGLGYAVSAGIQKGSEFTSDIYLKLSGKDADLNIGQIYSTATREQKAKASEQAWYKRIGYSLPTGDVFVNQKSFEESVMSQLQQKGITGKEAEKILGRLETAQKIRATGELGSLLYVSKTSEKTGRFVAGELFQKSAGKTFTKAGSIWEISKRTVPTAALLGYGEGFYSDVLQKESREYGQNLKESKTQGLFGSVSAGLFQFGTSGLSVAKPKISKGVQTIGYITDPLEYPGDVAETVSENILKKQFKRQFRESMVVQKDKDLFMLSSPKSTRVKTFTETFGFESQRKPQVMTSSQQQTKTQSQQRQRERTQEDIFTNVDNILKTNTQTRTNIFTNIDTFINTKQDINIPQKRKTENILDIPEETKTNIPTITGTETMIGSTTPLFRIPPPIPLGFPSGFGAQRVSRSKKVYINELDAGFNLFMGSLGSPKQGFQKTYGKIPKFKKLYGSLEGKKKNVKRKKKSS